MKTQNPYRNTHMTAALVILSVGLSLGTFDAGFAQAPAGRGQAPAGRGQAPAARGQAPAEPGARGQAPAAGRGAARGRGAAAGTPAPWFGLQLPPGFGKEPAVLVGDRAPRPVSVPAGEPASPEFLAATIRADLDTIVNFSKESRATKEFGSGQMWGRVSGFPSGAKTTSWAADQLRKAGISDVKVQPINVPADTRFWTPTSWEVKILGDPAFGPGSNDVVLESALPLSPSDIPGGTMTAPLVYVGSASPAVLQHIDVKGKIAVQLIIPQGHMVLERGPAGSRADALVERGAIGVFNLVRLPGNEYARDFSNCGNPCFNIGGRDGWFLENLFDRAAEAKVGDKLRAQITLKTESKTGLKADNAVAVIPGSRIDEAIVIDAHVDAWFDGAGDNADGLAVMIALARHFAKPANRPARTFIFVASAGHHSPGINGPRGFIEANPALAAKSALVINIEHVAQRNFSPARSSSSDGYRQVIADSGEAPIYAGITNRSPFVDNLFQQGVTRYGTNFVSERSNFSSGETGGFGGIAAGKVTLMQAPPLYHTTGEGEAVISTPGLERMARFLAYFLKETDKATRAQLNP